MPLFRIADRVLLFVHIPKTGGTSVEAMIKNAGGLEALRHSVKIPDLPCSPQHFHAALLEKLLPAGFADFAFTIVRNPYDRLASEYRMRVLEHGRDMRFDIWVERMFARYGRDPFVADNHLRPQSEFLFDGLEVFRFEDGAFAGIRDRLRALGLAIEGDIPWERRGMAQPIPTSPATVARIADFYAADFERLGYRPDDYGVSPSLGDAG